METKSASESKLDLTAAARWEALTVPYLIERAGLDPGKTAVVYPDGTRTYGELGVEEMDRGRRL